MIFLGIIFLVITIFTVLVVFGGNESRKDGQKTKQMIMVMETKYADFSDKRISIIFINDNKTDFDVEKLTNEIMVVLKPDIDGLISFINAGTYSGVKVEHTSKYFANLPSLASEMFKIKAERPDKVLNQQDEKEIFNSVKDAVKSDLTNKLVNLKYGTY